MAAVAGRAEAATPDADPETILKSTFGYDSFRPLQREVIGNVLARRDSLAIMPTGGGKSLCYQIPALFLNSEVYSSEKPLGG